MNRKAEKNLAVLVILIVALVSVVSVAVYYNTNAKITFTSEFGYTIETTEMASTFENLRAGIVHVNDTIKTVFPGDQSKMYATIFPWNKTPDHTLMMQTNMINLYVQRIDVSTAYYNSYKRNATAALVNDWYTITLQNVKTKWVNDGGFDLLWGVYTIQRFGAFGNFAINILPVIAFALIFFVIGFGMYFFSLNMESMYTITYADEDRTGTYHTRATTKHGALGQFRKNDGWQNRECRDKPVISIVKERED